MEPEPDRNTTTSAVAELERRFRLLRIAATIGGLLVVGCILLFDAINDDQFPDPTLLLPALAVIVALIGMHWTAARRLKDHRARGESPRKDTPR